MRRAARLLVAAVTVGGILFLFIIPGRIWLAQGRAESVAQRQDTALSQQNAALSRRAAQLQNPSYIQQIARQEYGLVMPGEKAYAIVEPPVATTTIPPAARAGHHHSLLRDLEFWN